MCIVCQISSSCVWVCMKLIVCISLEALDFFNYIFIGLSAPMFNTNWVSLAYYFFPTLLFSQRPCEQNIEWKLSVGSAYIYFGLPTNSFFTPPLSPTFPNPSLLGVPTMFGYCWKIHAMQMAPRILILTDFIMILQIICFA